jgi:hypothetical protein
MGYPLETAGIVRTDFIMAVFVMLRFESGAVIAPIPLFFRATVPAGSLFVTLRVLWVENAIERPDCPVHFLGRARLLPRRDRKRSRNSGQKTIESHPHVPLPKKADRTKRRAEPLHSVAATNFAVR